MHDLACHLELTYRAWFRLKNSPLEICDVRAKTMCIWISCHILFDDVLFAGGTSNGTAISPCRHFAVSFAARRCDNSLIASSAKELFSQFAAIATRAKSQLCYQSHLFQSCHASNEMRNVAIAHCEDCTCRADTSTMKRPNDCGELTQFCHCVGLSKLRLRLPSSGYQCYRGAANSAEERRDGNSL